MTALCHNVEVFCCLTLFAQTHLDVILYNWTLNGTNYFFGQLSIIVVTLEKRVVGDG